MSPLFSWKLKGMARATYALEQSTFTSVSTGSSRDNLEAQQVLVKTIHFLFSSSILVKRNKGPRILRAVGKIFPILISQNYSQNATVSLYMISTKPS